MNRVGFACVLLAMAPAVAVCDGYFRCGSALISADVSLNELVHKCGYPSSTETSVVAVRNQYGVKVGTSSVEVWRYDRGPRAAAMLVKVVDGKIQNIKDEPFGAHHPKSP
jgi:hypothetical protein